MKYILLKFGPASYAQALRTRLEVLSAGLATGTRVLSPAWFPYQRYYTRHTDTTLLGTCFSFLYQIGVRIHAAPLVSRLYDAVARGITLLNTASCVYALRGLVLLPQPQEHSSTYIVGTVVRARGGIGTHAASLRTACTLTPSVDARITAFIETHVPDNAVAIGVYIHQTPYAGFPDGTFLVHPDTVVATVDAYVRARSIDPSRVVLLTASDKPLLALGSYKVHPIAEDAVIQVHTLARTHVVIGSNTPEAYMAAWLGNVPYVLASSTPVIPSVDTYVDTGLATGALGSELTDAERQMIAAALQNQSHSAL